MVVSMSAGHFGATINQDNRPIFVPCSVCQEQGKSVEAYWLNEATGARLCNQHAQGYEKKEKAIVIRFLCLELPDPVPLWCEVGALVGDWRYCSVDINNPEIKETLEGEFDPAMSLTDLLDMSGFVGVEVPGEAG